MRIVLAVFIALLVLVQPVHAEERGECGVKITFGSYADGIDIRGYKHILELLGTSKEVDSYTDSAWGDAGQRIICVKTFSMQASDKFYDHALKYVPPISKKFWTEIQHEDGRIQKTQWPD